MTHLTQDMLPARRLQAAHRVTLLFATALLFQPAWSESSVPAAVAAASATVTANPLASAQALLGAGKLDEAIEELERIVPDKRRMTPADVDALMMLGRALGQKTQKASMLSQMGLAKRTKSAFERAATADDQRIEPKMALIEYFMQAPGFMGGGKEHALAQQQRIAALDPFRGKLAAARIAQLDKDEERRLTYLREAAAIKPDDGGLIMQLGYAAIERKAWVEAFELFTKAQAIESTARAASYQIGKTAALSGQHLARGEKALRDYIAQGEPNTGELPRLANARHRLGQVLLALGRPADARTEWEAALRDNPDLGEVKELLGRLPKNS